MVREFEALRVRDGGLFPYYPETEWYDALENSAAVECVDVSYFAFHHPRNNMYENESYAIKWLEAFNKNRKAKLKTLILSSCMSSVVAYHGGATRLYLLATDIIRRHGDTLEHVDMRRTWYQFVDEIVLENLVSALIVVSPYKLSWGIGYDEPRMIIGKLFEMSNAHCTKESVIVKRLLSEISTKRLLLSFCSSDADNIWRYLALNNHIEHLDLFPGCCMQRKFPFPGCCVQLKLSFSWWRAPFAMRYYNSLANALKQNVSVKGIVFHDVHDNVCHVKNLKNVREFEDLENAIIEQVKRNNTRVRKQRKLIKWTAIKRLLFI
jgi:hypothetical protein